MTKPGRVARPPRPTRHKLTIKSQVSRAVYWAQRNAQEAMQRDQQRQDDQAALLHQDVLPNWDESQTALTTTSLEDQSGSGNAAGSALGSGGLLPPDFVPAPPS